METNPDTSPSDSSFSKEDQQLLKQLQAPALHVQESAAYTFAVLMSLLVLLTLPIIYVGAVVAMGWVTWSLAAVGARLFSGGYWPMGICLWLVAAIGAAILLAMVKPAIRFAIAMFKHREPPMVLNPGQFPLLYAAINRLAETLHAPKPSEIRIDLDVNASAGPRSLLGGMLRPDSVLTIGLPLVYGMNVRQLLGVIAHEMGHFVQSGGGTDLTLFVRVVNGWLTDLALNGDRFDQWLADMAHSQVPPVRIVFWPPHFCVMVARRFFYLLMLIGHAASCFECRQKEFDADRYKTYISGSDAFAGTTMRMHMIGAAHRQAMEDLSESWQDERLPDNLPALIASRVAKIPDQRRQQVARLVLSGKTAWHETHPSESQRINAARRHALPGVVNDERPATVLFSRLDELAKQATRRQLEESLDEDFGKAQIVPVQTLIREQQLADEAFDSLSRYFQGDFQLSRPLLPAAVAAKAPDEPQAALDQLKAARRQMIEASKTIGTTLKEFEILDQRLAQARQAQAICAAGFRIYPPDFDLNIEQGTAPAVNQAVEELDYEFDRLKQKFEKYDKAAKVRLTRSLQLLHVPAVVNRLPEEGRDAFLGRAKKFIRAARALKEVHEHVREMIFQLIGLMSLAGVDERHVDRQVVRRVHDQTRMVAGWISNVRKSQFHIPYPFEHARGQISSAEFVVPKQPLEDDIAGVITAALETRERFGSLLARSVAQLTLISESVESAVGLKPLAAPQTPDNFETFVAECEAEAQRRGTLGHRTSAAAAIAAQVGITLALAALVIAGFFGFTVVAQSQDEWIARLTEPRTSANQRGSAGGTEDHPRGTRGDSQDNVTHGGVDGTTDGNSAVDGEENGQPSTGIVRPLPAPEPRVHYLISRGVASFASRIDPYEGQTFHAYGGYALDLPEGFSAPEVSIRRGDARWAIRYRWAIPSALTGSDGGELQLTISRNAGYRSGSRRIRTTSHERDKYGDDFVRTDDGYFILNGLPTTFSARGLLTKVVTFSHDGQQQLLMFHDEEALRCELLAAVDADQSEHLFPIVCSIGRTLRTPQPPVGDLRVPTDSLMTAPWTDDDNPLHLVSADGRPAQPPVDGPERPDVDVGSDLTADSPVKVVPLAGYATIYRLAFSSDGEHAACADSRGGIHYFRPGDAEPRATFEPMAEGSVGHLVIAREGAIVAAWTNLERRIDAFAPLERKHSKLLIKGVDVGAMKFSADGKLLAVGSGSRLLLWDATALQPLQQLKDLSGNVEAIDFSPNNQFVLLGLNDGAVVAWDRREDKVIFNETRHDDRVRTVAFSPDGRVILSTGDDDVMIWWDAANARPSVTRTDIVSRNSGFVLPEASHVVVQNAREVFLWNLHSGKLVNKYSVPRSGVAAFSHDHRRLLYTDGVVNNLAGVKLWTLAEPP